MAFDVASLSRGDYVLGRAEQLLRLGRQLTGDPDAALVALCTAIGRLPRTRHVDDLDRAVTVGMVRSCTRRLVPGPRSGGPLDSLARGQRTSVVLAFGLGWDPEAIAEVRRSSPGRVRREVAQALRDRTEDDWRAVLADPAWSVPVPGDLLDRVRRERAAMRRRRRIRLAVSASVAAAVVGLGITVDRIVNAPAPAPPTAHVGGLLAWPARGSLIRDAHFVAAAERLWQASALRPAGRIYVLYADRIGVGRIAVLQALESPGRGEVAVVADHDVTYRHPRLRLDEISPLSNPAVPVLVIPYDGNLNIPGLVAGPGSRVEQLLAAPGVDRVEERSLRSPRGAERPAYAVQPLHRGMSTPWLDLTGTLPATAVRANLSNGQTFTGIIAARGAQPTPLAAVPSPAAADWAGLPHPFSTSGLADDVVWWAQVCSAPDPTVQLVWTGHAPGFPTAIRFELVRCPNQGAVRGAFLTGVGGGTLALAELTGSAEAYVGYFAPADGGRHSTLVIGSRRVAAIVTRSQTVPGRVALLVFEKSGGLRILDASGHPVSVR